MNLPLALAIGMVSAVSIAVSAATNDPGPAQIEGQRIAREVRELRLTGDASGTLKLFKGRKKIAEIPFQLVTTLTPTNWSTTYTTFTTNPAHSAVLIVTHTPGGPNEYRVSGPDTNRLSALSGGETMIPFAGSDYWAADLGLEFLHWPGQRLVTNELRRSQSCHRLESTNPNPVAGGYSRVLAWLDIDTGGVVLAEAYDTRGLVKIFEPTKVEKVNGRYQVSELEIRNKRTDTRTVLEFNYDHQ